MEAWGLTDTGNVREENQDFYRMERLGPETLLAVVCDGMGGARAGNVASRLACEVFCGEVCRSLRDGMTEAEEQDVLCTAAKLANISVYEHAQLSEEFRGMGTTLVAALVRGLRVEIVNIGDSRAYHLGADGIRCVTVDHSLVELMVQRGELTHEQAKNHPSKNLITRAVGTEKQVAADVFSLTAEPATACCCARTAFRTRWPIRRSYLKSCTAHRRQTAASACLISQKAGARLIT